MLPGTQACAGPGAAVLVGFGLKPHGRLIVAPATRPGNWAPHPVEPRQGRLKLTAQFNRPCRGSTDNGPCTHGLAPEATIRCPGGLKNRATLDTYNACPTAPMPRNKHQRQSDDRIRSTSSPVFTGAAQPKVPQRLIDLFAE